MRYDGIDLKLLPSELKLLLSFMRADCSERIIQSEIEQVADVDWDHFLLLSRHHRLVPFLHHRMKQLSLTGIPPYVLQTISREYRNNTLQMMQLSGEMTQVSKQLSERGIRSIMLKGPVVAVDLYGSLSLRTSSDLDILVHLDDLEHVERILAGLGYVKEGDLPSVLNDWKWRHHHIAFYHPAKRVKLEIHWRLNPGPSKEPGFDELWQRRRVSAISAEPVHLLGREDLFLFLISHGARHGWSRLRWLLDINQISQQELDADLVMKLLRSNHFLQTAGQALFLCSELLHTPLNSSLQQLAEGKRARKLAQDAMFYIRQLINLHTDPLPIEVARYHKQHLFALMSIQQKSLFLLSFLFPYPMDTQTLPLPKSLHMLYFPLRPFLWAWRKTRRHGYQE
ncbi:nucleotidyltransferase domain-containing protein [Paenibacillus spongiae]|uniref:Nucleotidyltransferase family protein n=1 Tax=Paenibacillus spongiae TaxID=2909671 RepID=A0ABY5SGA9_9BACL|nr:nucleotidyltransferase family protein [Paenibacillus spongiae]UVI31530.1 nucleotidyltransferase family protein [Paenibacillus spongiae]